MTSVAMHFELVPLELFQSEGREPDNFLHILLVVANKGPLIKNEIASELRVREGEISRRVDWLLSTGFLEVASIRRKQSRYRTIELKEYRVTLKGVFAISHLKALDPAKVIAQHPEIPPVIRELMLSFGADRVRHFINRVGFEVKNRIDDQPSFEEMTDLGALFFPMLTVGVKELPVLFGGTDLSKDAQERLQRVLIEYSDTIVKFIDDYVAVMTAAVDGLKQIRENLVAAKIHPEKIAELLKQQEQSDSVAAKIPSGVPV